MRRKVGCYLSNGQCYFSVWAPEEESVKINLVSKNKTLILNKEDFGYWTCATSEAGPGDLYKIRLGEEDWPDPASQYQPEGVHGPSGIVDHASFKWSDQEWKGMKLKDMIIYELHTGTFTPEGTFGAISGKLDYLTELGINAIEIMPVGQFPGNRNWGYDVAFPFAVQNSYGGPDGLKSLIDECHKKGIAVIIDAVYNHFGPEGAYGDKFGKYHTEKYNTPWGQAINFDDAYSDEVRNYFIQNALMWFRDYHVDALRLDAIHACKDTGAFHFVKELTLAVKELEKETGRLHVLIGEVDLNDPKYITPVTEGGLGLDGQWCDEFHHALRSIVSGDRDGYYEDFGTLEHMRRAYQDSYVYSGQYSQHRKKTFGLLPEKNPYSQFIIFGQNHDQVGNRLLGDRISTLLSFGALKLVAASVLLSPSVPLLFMGEEFGEDAPFQYFVSHSDQNLIEAIREGRKKEFSYFNFKGEAPDPQSEEAFNKSKLNWNFGDDNQKKTLLGFYQTLIRLRKTHPAFSFPDRSTVRVKTEGEGLLILERLSAGSNESSLLAAFNYADKDVTFSITGKGKWKLFMDTEDNSWGGAGRTAPETALTGSEITVKGHSAIVYLNQPA